MTYSNPYASTSSPTNFIAFSGMGMRKGGRAMLMPSNYQGDGSTLNLDFTTGVLDPRLTFTRSTTATYINSSGYVTTMGAAPTNDPTKARFDYSPTNIGEPRGLSVEGQAINLCAYGQYCWGGTWGTAQEVHINSVNGTSGTQYVDRIAGPDNGTLTGTSVFKQAGSTYVRLNTVETVSALQQYTYSMWVRAGTGGATYFQLAPFNGTSPMTTVGSCSDSGVTINNTSAFGSTFSNLPSNRWVRVSVVFTTVSGQSSVLLTVYPNLFTSAASTNYIWGAQLETGSVASSTILTGASQVTRTVDTCYMSGISSWYNESAGTVISNITYDGLATNNSGIELSVGTGTSATNRIGIRKTYVDYYSGGGSAQAEMYPTVTSGNVRIGTAYSLNDFAMCSNGGTMLADGSGAVPVGLNTLKLYADNGTSGLVINGLIKSIKYFPTRLSNAQLQALTAP